MIWFYIWNAFLILITHLFSILIQLLQGNFLYPRVFSALSQLPKNIRKVLFFSGGVENGNWPKMGFSRSQAIASVLVLICLSLKLRNRGFPLPVWRWWSIDHQFKNGHFKLKVYIPIIDRLIWLKWFAL